MTWIFDISFVKFGVARCVNGHIGMDRTCFTSKSSYSSFVNVLMGNCKN